MEPIDGAVGRLNAAADEEDHVHSNAESDGALWFLNEPLVVFVRADPEPNHFITFDRP